MKVKEIVEELQKLDPEREFYLSDIANILREKRNDKSIRRNRLTEDPWEYS